MEIVMNRSRQELSVLAPIIAGTVQPEPMIIGMKAESGKPILRIRRSAITLTLAIYPRSSKMASVMNMKKTTGIKVATVCISVPILVANIASKKIGIANYLLSTTLSTLLVKLYFLSLTRRLTSSQISSIREY